MSCMHLSYTAMTGLPVVRDPVTRAIASGRSLDVFANFGMFEEHHLRVLVTMPRTPMSVIKMVAGEANTNPAKAIDYCSSAVIARGLIKICGDVSRFSLYDQQTFKDGAVLHDNRKGADRFRRMDIVFEVLCERVLFGGDILPPHVAKWFVSYGENMFNDYMLKNGSVHMMACYEICEKQLFEHDEQLITPNCYEFMIKYHRYVKYLPLVMHFVAVFNKKQSTGEYVRDMVEKRCSAEQIESFVRGEQIKDMVDLKSPQQKKRRRRLSRAMKSDSIKQLYGVAQRIIGLGCCERLILSFL